MDRSRDAYRENSKTLNIARHLFTLFCFTIFSAGAYILYFELNK